MSRIDDINISTIAVGLSATSTNTFLGMEQLPHYSDTARLGDQPLHLFPRDTAVPVMRVPRYHPGMSGRARARKPVFAAHRFP
jgi:hypothetical protein